MKVMPTDPKKLVAEIQKDNGEGAISIGVEVVDVDRQMTGVFAFDLASGGGFPKGKISLVYGPESSGKTNLCLLAIAQAQKEQPDKYCVFVDIEHSFDAKWAQALGVDTEKLIVIKPSHGEVAVDNVIAFIKASDINVIVTDSLAALTPINETTSSAGKASVGGNSQLIGKLMRLSVFALSDAEREGRHPTILFINQIRHKIGQMFGNPEYMPGGNMMRHTSGLTVRLYGTNMIIKEVSAVMPAVKDTKVVIKKWKVPIVSINAEYNMAMIPHAGLRCGQTKDWGTVLTYLKSMEHVKKSKKGWMLFDEEYKILNDCRDYIYETLERESMVKQLIIEAAVLEANGTPEELAGE